MRILNLLSFLIIFCGVAFSQSILDVPAQIEGEPVINALTIYVEADTNAQGEQLHDIYRLQRGATYFYNQSPIFRNPITLIADEPGTDNATKPPKILITNDDEGGIPYAHCIETYANLTIKNIAFSTTSIDEQYSWANTIYLHTDGLRIKLEGVHFELTGWGIIEAPVENSVIIMDKCHLRNGTVIPYGDEWCPFFISESPSIDTVIARNCTFFNLQGSVINIDQQNPVNYLKFDHNTMVNIVKGFSTEINAHLNSTFTNNIFYNVSVHGSIIEDIQSGAGDNVVGGILTVDTLYSNVSPDSAAFIMDEADRKMVIKNNAYFFSAGVTGYFEAVADTIEASEFLDSRAQAMFDDDVSYPNFVEENNVNIDPGFTNFGGTDQMVSQLFNHREGEGFGFWGWDPDSADYPDVHWAFLQWPLPEDFSYSATIASTDGYHVGSLMYYPDELAAYELTAIEENNYAQQPHKFNLSQNYPNPFNPATNIEFILDKTASTSLVIYNTIGQRVKIVLDNKVTSAGFHKFNIDMSDQSTGIYFYELIQNNNRQVKKMVLMK